MQMVKNHAYYMCCPVCLRQCSVRAESVYALRGAEALGRCLVLWWSIFMPVVGAEWLCRHPMSTVWMAAAGVL